MTADQCLEHAWLKQYPKKADVIETIFENECKTNDIVTPAIEVVVSKCGAI